MNLSYLKYAVEVEKTGSLSGAVINRLYREDKRAHK